ncbi:hypothetical protein D3C73_795060 [compost metagenome]
MCLSKLIPENNIKPNPIMKKNSFFLKDRLLNLPSLCIIDKITPTPSSQARVGNIKNENRGAVLVKITQDINDISEIIETEATTFLLSFIIIDRTKGRKM